MGKKNVAYEGPVMQVTTTMPVLIEETTGRFSRALVDIAHEEAKKDPTKSPAHLLEEVYDLLMDVKAAIKAGMVNATTLKLAGDLSKQVVQLQETVTDLEAKQHNVATCKKFMFSVLAAIEEVFGKDKTNMTKVVNILERTCQLELPEDRVYWVNEKDISVGGPSSSS